MAFDWSIDDGRESSVPGSDLQLDLARYRAQAFAQPRKVLRVDIEIPVPTPRVAAFLLAIAVLHAFAVYLVVNNHTHAIARVIAPIVVEFLPSQRQETPPEPLLLEAAALVVDADPVPQILPPALAFDAFEPESRAITTAVTAVKKAPQVEASVAEEEEIDGNFVRPRPIRGRLGKQRYPDGAAAAGESGRATVKICISARGDVESVEITESTGFDRLDNDALDIARDYRFRPARRNGKAIPVCLPYSIVYRMN